MRPILIGNKFKSRILRPTEFEQLLSGIKKESMKLNLKVALLTGMRYIELQEFQRHPDWFDGNFIYLQERKKKRVFKQRWVRLSPLGKHLVPLFFKNKRLPYQQVWNENLIRWCEHAGLNPVGVSSKVTRKTWESWLVFCYPHLLPQIVFSQGHSDVTAVQHYIRLPFTSKDKKEMMKWVQGWDE